jgi:hypothetical protein
MKMNTQAPWSMRRLTQLPKKFWRIPRFMQCIEHYRIIDGENPGAENRG